MHITKGKADWIDVLSPSREDLDWFKNRFGFEDAVLNELRSPSDQPKLDAYNNYLFLVHHFPVYDAGRSAFRRSEIDFIITKHQIITVHYEKLEPLLWINSERAKNSMELSYHILGTLLDFELDQLRRIKNKVEHLGTKLLADMEHEILKNISVLKRNISDYHSIIRHHEPVLDSFLMKGVDFWGPHAAMFLHALLGTNEQIASQIENCREALDDLESTNNQLMHLNTKRHAKTFISLGLFSSLFLFLASALGLFLGNDPIMDMLWYVVGAVSLVLIFSLVYLMRKKRI